MPDAYLSETTDEFMKNVAENFQAIHTTALLIELSKGM
jgi:hypothetical protein